MRSAPDRLKSVQFIAIDIKINKAPLKKFMLTKQDTTFAVVNLTEIKYKPHKTD